MDNVQSYQFGRSEQQVPVNLSGVDRLGERLVRYMRPILESMLGTKPDITVQAAETVNYDLWAAMAPTFSALSTYRLHPLKGAMLLRIDAAMISGIVERFYGGSGNRPGAARNEFTPSEDRVIAKLSDAVMQALARLWGDILPMEAHLVGREHDPQALTFADATDQLLMQGFTIDAGRNESWTIEMLIPLVALRQLEPLLAGNTADEVRKSDPLWQSRIAQQMGAIRLPAKSVLARPNLTLTELLSLKPGDVIPVNIARYLPLIVGDRVIAQGTIGEQNGHAAFMIEKMS